MTHILRPSRRRSLIAATFATLLTFGVVAPSFAQALPGTQGVAAAGGSAVATPLTASASLASLSTLASSHTSWSAGQAAADRALSQVGSSYRWGSNGPGAYDCSGLTSSAWSAAGVDIPRTARAQSNSVRSISRSELRPGDLVFFGSPATHVEMYVGDGQLVWASVSEGRVTTGPIRYRSNISGYGRP